MAKTTFITLLPEEEGLYYRGLQTSDRFTIPRIRRKSLLLSKAKKRDLAGRSLLSYLSTLWRAFSQVTKDEWNDIGDLNNLNGWQMFVKDTAARIKAGLSGVATPNDFHQARVGQLHIESPSTELKIIQVHPEHYYISRKVTGKKSMRELVKITEKFALPLELKINYKSNLVSAGAGSFAKFYARIRHLYQGRDIYTNLEISLDLVGGWKTASANVSDLLGLAIGYDLYIHLYNVTGDVYIDQVEANHSGQNWARDPYCVDINEGFTKAFVQVPKHWASVTVPVGSEFESIYKDF